MIEAIGAEGTTPLHRLAAGPKLAGLAVLATALFFVDALPVLGAAVGLGLIAARSTGRTFSEIARDLRGAAIVIVAIGVIDLVALDASTAATVTARLFALMLFAHAVTLTTPLSAFAETLERGLAPFERLGLVDAARVSLTLTLALRFVPTLVEEAREIREAQAARGLESHPLALVVPLVVRVLIRAEEVADAVDARGFPPPSPLRSSNR